MSWLPGLWHIIHDVSRDEALNYLRGTPSYFSPQTLDLILFGCTNQYTQNTHGFKVIVLIWKYKINIWNRNEITVKNVKHNYQNMSYFEIRASWYCDKTATKIYKKPHAEIDSSEHAKALRAYSHLSNLSCLIPFYGLHDFSRQFFLPGNRETVLNIFGRHSCC